MVPCISELCGLRLDYELLQNTTPAIRVSASLPDQDGMVMVSIHADLRRLFAEMVTARSSECSWRLCKSALGTTSEQIFGVNSVDVDGIGVDSALTPSDFQIPLLPHQRSSLAWMTMRESAQELCVCERRCQKPVKAAGADLKLDLQVSEVFSLRGGVLCDVVGSGKTATVLALISSHRRQTGRRDGLPTGTARATLVLCPPNVHAQWLAEVEKFCPSLRALSVRAKDDLEQASHDLSMRADVVVAPYELFVLPGVARSADALKDLSWRRVVLDEFHELCSEKDSKKHFSLRLGLDFLKTESQWALSGTPESFLHSARAVVNAADYFRCKVNERTAPIFVEHFCRQSRVEIPVGVHEHVVHVAQTPAERTLYLAYLQQSKCRDGEWDAADLQTLLLLCSHFLPEEDSESPIGACHLSADEVCSAMLQQKEDALTIAKGRVNALSKSALLDLCGAVETMDQKISSAMKEMASSLANLSGMARAEDQQATRQALESLSSALLQPRRVKSRYIDIIKDWCRNDGKPRYIALALCSRGNKIVGTDVGGQELFCIEAPGAANVRTLRDRIADALEKDFDDVRIHGESGVSAADCPSDPSSLTVGVRQPEAVRLLDLCSPAELLEFCGAVESLRKRCKAMPSLEQRLRRPLHVLLRGCESILGAQRGLDYFHRTWEAFRAGNVSCPVCFEEIDVYLGNFLFCGHAICVGCRNELRESRCPICRCEVPGLQRASGALPLARQKVVPVMKPPVMEYRKHWSSKICKMLETVENIHTSSPGAKVIVFSQWDSLRRHVSQALHDRSVEHLILEGSIFDRSRTLEQFRSDPSVSLLLLSLEDSASGTNLTVASHVFLLHPMLARSQAEAASFEAQAVGRVRRLGQAEPVHVWRFVTAGTVEEELYEANAARTG